MLKTGDRLAIIGDSITEQKMYSRIIENYLTACVPDLKITVRQYGWSGEKTDGFLNRMDRDCLNVPAHGGYIVLWHERCSLSTIRRDQRPLVPDHYTAIVRKFKEKKCAGRGGLARLLWQDCAWVKGKSGTLEEHNLNLCALRDIALEVAEQEKVAFADIFWPCINNASWPHVALRKLMKSMPWLVKTASIQDGPDKPSWLTLS